MGKKRNFSASEEAALIEAMNITDEAEKERRLDELARIMGREKRVLKNHYDNYTKTDKSKFTDEEDALLLFYHDKLGNKWKEIAKFFVGRSGAQLSTRYRNLVRNGKAHHVPMYTAPGPIPPPEPEPIVPNAQPTVDENKFDVNQDDFVDQFENCLLDF